MPTWRQVPLSRAAEQMQAVPGIRPPSWGLVSEDVREAGWGAVTPPQRTGLRGCWLAAPQVEGQCPPLSAEFYPRGTKR